MGRRRDSHRDLARVEARHEYDHEYLDVVSGPPPWPPSVRAHHDLTRRQLGGRYYAELIFALLHVWVEPQRAQVTWSAITAHRAALTEALGRRVDVTVAAVDYATHISGEVPSPVIVPKSFFDDAARLATHDRMTGLYDHSTFRLRLDEELRRADRYGGSVSVLMIDVDEFKRFNDTHGHPAGDRVLIALARRVCACVRDLDHVARYGGEELVIVAPRTGPDAARCLGERVRRSVEASLPITISVGVASAPPARSAPALIEAADAALYTSKARGRNRTTSHTELALG
ncbi:MAG: GGDEF domain-containing protein [Sandaracinaceae bacterium]|nr:GGDEF domain-containing protein [Sandaracinaceae bacterium]